MSTHSDAFSYPPRGMNRVEAARYIGVAPSTFDSMIVQGTVPKPKMARGRLVWDRIALDMAFNELPDKDKPTESFDEFLESRRKK